MRICGAFLLISVPFLVAAPGMAQTTAPARVSPADPNLIHLDTPALPAQKQMNLRLDVRAFGGKEDTTYTGVSVQYGFGSGWAGIARGGFAPRKNYTLGGGSFVRHGGNDVELAARYQFPQTPWIALLAGVAFPDTSAQNDPVVTLGVSGSAELGRNVTGYLNPRAVLLKDDPLFGLGAGVQARFSPQVALIGDVTFLLAGDNTRHTSDGSRQRATVYGVAFRFTPQPRGTVSFDLGYASGTGTTTGFAMTPGLGGSSGAFFASVSFGR